MLRVSLFGGVHIELDEASEQVKLTYTVQALFAYLLLNRQKTHPRDILAGLFWGECSTDRAHNCLNTAVWRLRRVLEHGNILAGKYLISTSREELGFNTQSDYWLDVDRFENQVERSLTIPIEIATEKDIFLLEQTAKLYTGDLLEGYYFDWALQERERLRCIYLNCLYYLMRFFSTRDPLKALAYGQEILNIDPLREDVHRQMMLMYLNNGQRARAVKQYNICQETLKHELGILPMIETRLLYGQIMEMDNSSVADLNPPHLEVHQAIERLASAMGQMSEARENLRRALVQLSEQQKNNSPT